MCCFQPHLCPFVITGRSPYSPHSIISALPRIDLENPQTAQHTEYFTTIANVDYRFHPNWNAYLKGIYESGKIYKANGIFEKGTYRRTWCGQVCVEYYPMRNSELLIFLHYQYKRISP